MKNELSIKQRIKACFILLVSGSLPSWWWSDLSNKFYESKIAHNYKDGKSVGVHIEPGPDGGLVMLDDTKILDVALRILDEQGS